MKGENSESLHSHGHCCFILNERGNVVRQCKTPMRWNRDSIIVSMVMDRRHLKVQGGRENAQGFMLHAEVLPPLQM